MDHCQRGQERRGPARLFPSAEAYSAGVVVAAAGGVTGAEPLSSAGGVQPATMQTQKTNRLQTTRVVRFDIENTLLSIRQQAAKASILNVLPAGHNGGPSDQTSPLLGRVYHHVASGTLNLAALLVDPILIPLVAKDRHLVGLRHSGVRSVGLVTRSIREGIVASCFLAYDSGYDRLPNRKTQVRGANSRHPDGDPDARNVDI